jgi:uncharacterized protein CbrC (UPF0167 family)
MNAPCPLFAGPTSEMVGYVETPTPCTFCGTIAPGIDLRRAHRTPYTEAQRAGKVGCLTCLTDGRFTFFHITQVGYLFEDGLRDPFQDRAIPESKHHISPESIELLRRTPQFPSWNEVEWPVHCNDFMVFLGPWKPTDFGSNAKAEHTTAKALFRRMTPRQDHGIWPAEDLSEWPIGYLTYFAFRCRPCGRLHGVIDLG